ncbi:hypothetical protein HMPREF0496_2281 [Lentilactobacillus hilgardii ATCC 27305]|nr:hypothetical protein HMPREF0496_2281 [Lentilactobacillus hilgardii ATCC 27305]
MIFGTLFFNSPKGKGVIQRGVKKQTASSSQQPSNGHYKNTTLRVRSKLKSTTLLFKHPFRFQLGVII